MVYITTSMEEDDNLIDYNQWEQSLFGLEPESFNLTSAKTSGPKSVMSSQLSAKSEIKNPFFTDAGQPDGEHVSPQPPESDPQDKEQF